QLLRRFKDPRPIITLVSTRILSVDNNNSNRRYLPTILAFHNCGDDNVLTNARNAVEVVIRDLKRLFETNYDQDRRYEPSARLSEFPDYVPIADQIALGLFLVKDMPNTIYAQMNEGGVSVSSFQINEHILTQDPEKVWDNYVRLYSPSENTIAQ